MLWQLRLLALSLRAKRGLFLTGPRGCRRKGRSCIGKLDFCSSVAHAWGVLFQARGEAEGAEGSKVRGGRAFAAAAGRAAAAQRPAAKMPQIEGPFSDCEVMLARSKVHALSARCSLRSTKAFRLARRQ